MSSRISIRPRVVGGSGGGGISSESDPVATAALAAHAGAADPHGDRADATTKVAAHAGAADPHGDRADATTKVAAHTGAADPHGDRADATTKVAAHTGASTGAHASTAISFDDSGLIVVKGASVKAALAAIDVWTQTRPWNGGGHLVDLPANGSYPDGSTYLTDDSFGGQLLIMRGGVWTPAAPGLGQTTAKVAGPVWFVGPMDLIAASNTWTDVPGMSLDIPASASKDVVVRFKTEVAVVTGTVAANTAINPQIAITDQAGLRLAMDPVNLSQGGAAASRTMHGKFVVELVIPAPVSAQTVKLMARLQAAAPSGLTSAQILPGVAAITGPAGPRSAFYAVAM